MAITVAFTTLVVFEMVRVQSVRMKYKVGLFSNKNLLLAMATSILLQLFVVYGPLLHTSLVPIHGIFAATYLGLEQWIQIIGLSIVLMIILIIKDKFFPSGI